MMSLGYFESDVSRVVYECRYDRLVTPSGSGVGGGGPGAALGLRGERGAVDAGVLAARARARGVALGGRVARAAERRHRKRLHVVRRVGSAARRQLAVAGHRVLVHHYKKNDFLIIVVLVFGYNKKNSILRCR